MPLQLRFPQFPQFAVIVHKFSSVRNAKQIKDELLQGNETYDFAFITAKTIVSIEQLSSAIYRALLDHTKDRIRTRTLHSEVIFSLSPSSNIGDALRKFGIQDDSEDLVIVKILETEVPYDLSIVDGEEVEVTDEEFERTVDYGIIKNNYKIDSQDPGLITRQTVNSIQLRGH